MDKNKIFVFENCSCGRVMDFASHILNYIFCKRFSVKEHYLTIYFGSEGNSTAGLIQLPAQLNVS